MNMREAQAAETREKLLSSARRLFSEKGYQGTTVREINRSVKLADGLLYHYFPDGKREIFRTILEESARQSADLFLNSGNIAVYENLPVVEMLEAVYQDFSNNVRENIDVLRIVFREEEARSIITDDRVLCMIRGQAPWFTEILKRKYNKGEIREMDFEAAGVSIEGLLFNRVVGIVYDLSDEGQYEARMRLFRHFASLWSIGEAEEVQDEKVPA
ncbi:MAG: TetR/AcrR family transcriptional regulator [Lachnospiraceae bacterium]|nr:TetR/AcrR family transcriptional regulator [Lachnospiraceae bacterium]